MKNTKGNPRLSVTLVNWSNNASDAVMAAAAVCYKAASPEKALAHAVESGHESVLEHSSYTFRIRGISRACLAQLTRHRIASYTVQSQRYVDQAQADTVTPPSIAGNKEAMAVYGEAVTATRSAYIQLLDLGIPKEDARFILPEATETELYVTMKARELRHFLSLRCCNRAQWEIRSVADKMLQQAQAVSPLLFADAGPGCLRGHCPEKRPCKHPRSDEV